MQNKKFLVGKLHTRGWGAKLCALSLLGWGLATEVAAQPAPSRFQRCNADVASLTGATRKIKLKDCLNIRLEAERLVERSCRKQLASSPNANNNATDRSQLQKACVTNGLKAHYDELPKTAPRPKPAASAATGAVGSPSAAAPAKPQAPTSAKPAPVKAATPPAKPAAPAVTNAP